MLFLKFASGIPFLALIPIGRGAFDVEVNGPALMLAQIDETGKERDRV